MSEFRVDDNNSFKNLYSDNLLDFYEFINNKDLIYKLQNDEFLIYRIYPGTDIIRNILKTNDMYRFIIIDFFLNNKDLIMQRDIKINNLLRKHDIKKLDLILKSSHTDFSNMREKKSWSIFSQLKRIFIRVYFSLAKPR